jgi:branched-chain amino acid transport system permease protein
MHLFAQAIILGILTGGVYALMTSGLTISFGTMRIINLAQGAFVILGSYLTYSLFIHAGVEPFLSVLITAPVMFGLGVILQVTLLRPLKHDAHKLSLLMTFAMAIGIEGMLSLVYTTDFRSINTSYSNSSWDVLSYHIPVVRVFAFAVSAIVLGLLYLLLERTRFGRAVRATSQGSASAKLLGVNTARISAIGFGVGAATGAAAGAVYGVVYSFDPVSQVDLIGRLLAIVVLGGLGSYLGAGLAAILLGVSEAVVQAMISPAWSSFPFYILLIVVLIVRPQGLLGRVERGAL